MKSRSMVRTLVLLGAFTALSLLLTAVVVTSLLNYDSSPSRHYSAIFTDGSVLQHGDPVRIAGVEVGRVTGVGLDGNRARISFTVDQPQQVTTTTHAQIQFENLFGQRNLTLTDPGGGHLLASGSTIPLARTAPALDLTDLFNGFQPLFQALTPTQINALAGNLIAAFQGQGSTISSLVQQTAALTNNLADRQSVLDQVINNLNGVLATVGAHDTQLGHFIDSFAALSTTLTGERDQIGTALANASSVTSGLSGLLGSLQPSLQSSIANLTGVTGALAANQQNLDGLITVTPATLRTLSTALQDGSFAKIYICRTVSNPDAPLPLSPVQLPASLTTLVGSVSNLVGALLPGLSSTGQLAATQSVTLPSGELGNPAYNTPNCKS